MANERIPFTPGTENDFSLCPLTISDLSQIQGRIIPTVDGASYYELYVREPESNDLGPVFYMTSQDYSTLCQRVAVYQKGNPVNITIIPPRNGDELPSAHGVIGAILE